MTVTDEGKAETVYGVVQSSHKGPHTDDYHTSRGPRRTGRHGERSSPLRLSTSITQAPYVRPNTTRSGQKTTRLGSFLGGCDEYDLRGASRARTRVCEGRGGARDERSRWPEGMCCWRGAARRRVRGMAEVGRCGRALVARRKGAAIVPVARGCSFLYFLAMMLQAGFGWSAAGICRRPVAVRRGAWVRPGKTTRPP